MYRRVGVGSTNIAKLAAVRELLPSYAVWENSEIMPVQVHTTVGRQPMSLDETIKGAQERARGSLSGCSIGIGLESGLSKLPRGGGRLINVCVCVIFDGGHYFFGQSSGFVLPVAVERLVRGGLELNQAFLQSGFSNDPASSQKEGVVEFLSGGRVDRKLFTQEAIIMALADHEFRFGK